MSPATDYIYKYSIYLEAPDSARCDVECYLLIMGEERKCTSRVRKCTVNNPLITHLARFLGRQRMGTQFLLPLRNGVVYILKKHRLFISALDILKCFLGVASTFLLLLSMK